MQEAGIIKNITQNSKLVYLLLWFGTKDVNDSLLRLVADLIITFCRLGVMLLLYKALYEYKGGEIMGVSFQLVAWGMFFYIVFNFIAPRYLSRDIQSDIQTGKVEVLFSKPVSYMSYKLGEYLGHRFWIFLVSSTIGFLLMYSFLDFPQNILNWNFVFTFPIVITFCFIITFQMSVIVGLLSFWIEDTQSIRWLLDKVTMILGGAYFPVAFFPGILKNLSLYTPFGASQFITYSAYPSWQQDYLWMFGVQIFWIIAIGIVLFWLQRKAFKNLSVNGG